MKLLMANLVALTLIGGAIYLCAIGNQHWGWFLFVGLLCYVLEGLKD